MSTVNLFTVIVLHEIRSRSEYAQLSLRLSGLSRMEGVRGRAHPFETTGGLVSKGCVESGEFNKRTHSRQLGGGGGGAYLERVC